MLIDTHTHIYLDEFAADVDEVVNRALDNGVGMMLLPNVSTQTIKPMLDLVERFPDCTRAMIGIQPEEVRDDYKHDLDVVEKEIERGIYCGIGEIGLDFYWDTTYEKQQLDAFATQLDWAKQLNLPVSVHCRNAFDRMVKILEKKQDGSLRGVMHCFTGTEEEAKAYVGLGFHLGLGGVVTFKNCGVCSFLSSLPPDRIVLETDAPYLSPVPYRGKRNEPAHLVATAGRIAEAWGMNVEETSAITTDNAIHLFNLHQN